MSRLLSALRFFALAATVLFFASTAHAANKVTLAFAVHFSSDGSSTGLVVNLTTGPVGYTPPGGAGNVLIGALVVGTTGFEALDGDWTSPGVTGTVLLGVAIFTFANPAPSGLHTVSGRLLL